MQDRCDCCCHQWLQFPPPVVFALFEAASVFTGCEGPRGKSSHWTGQETGHVGFTREVKYYSRQYSVVLFPKSDTSNPTSVPVVSCFSLPFLNVNNTCLILRHFITFLSRNSFFPFRCLCFYINNMTSIKHINWFTDSTSFTAMLAMLKSMLKSRSISAKLEWKASKYETLFHNILCYLLINKCLTDINVLISAPWEAACDLGASDWRPTSGWSHHYVLHSQTCEFLFTDSLPDAWQPRLTGCCLLCIFHTCRNWTSTGLDWPTCWTSLGWSEFMRKIRGGGYIVAPPAVHPGPHIETNKFDTYTEFRVLIMNPILHEFALWEETGEIHFMQSHHQLPPGLFWCKTRGIPPTMVPPCGHSTFKD